MAKFATPLYVACDRGHAETVSVLLEGGATVDQANKNGATPLYIAKSYNHASCVELLRKAGAH